ncbi:MAG: hypothetical protein KDC87_03895 [Planctomycetes bacterium]|nr:hypothetical protein [Planctomycetota bacterium]MCB9869866.1 hypothetical protein [Planctomycetota bacterium]MCB9889096.1 hypothetical protein [Planctomycetota bacterium]
MRLPGFVSQVLLPVTGLAAVGVAGYLRYTLPQPADVTRMEARVSALGDNLAALRSQPIVGEETFATELPEALEVNALLRDVHDAAVRAGLVSIRFALDEERPAASAAVVEMVPGGPPGNVAVPGPQTATGPSTRKAERLHCRLDVQASYQGFVRFLGSLEAMKPTTSVHALELTAGEQVVSASLALDFLFLPRRKAR